MSETNAVAEWLYTTMKAGTALCAYLGGTANPRIYEDFAPGTVTRPFVVFQLVSADDMVSPNGYRQTTFQEWSVLAVTKAQTYNAVKPIADAFDTLLHQKHGTAAINNATLTCVRSGELRYTSEQDGAVWKYMGGYYRIMAGST